MITWALSWLGKAKLKLLVILGVLLLIVVFVWRVMRIGAKASNAERLEKSIKNVKVQREVKQSIDKLSDADIDQRMQQRGDFRD